MPKVVPTYILVIILFLIGVAIVIFPYFNNAFQERRAVEIIKSLPEVKKLQTYPHSFVWIDRIEGNYFIIQTGTINGFEDEVTHTATFNWYKVDKDTGKIACSMHSYDNKGNYINKIANACP